MKRFVIILLISCFCSGPCFAQGTGTYKHNIKKMSLPELERERAGIRRQIQKYKNSSNNFDKAFVATREKHLRLVNAEIARRPKPRNPVPDNPNDASLTGEKQERDDRIRLEEQCLKQRAYDATMVRTQPYYDNLKANAAYHASAEGVAVASAIVDPSRFINPGQADYIPSDGPPRVYASDKATVKRRMRQMRNAHQATVSESEDRERTKELESLFSACSVYDYPPDKSVVNVFDEVPPNVRDGDECSTAIFIQKIDSSEFPIINAAMVFSLPRRELQVVEANGPERFCDPLESDWDTIYEDLSARCEKKFNTLLMLNNIVATCDSEIGGNLIDAAENVNKIVARTTVAGFADRKIPGVSNAKSAVFESLMGLSINEIIENDFDNKRKMYGTSEQVPNPVAEKLGAMRDGADLGDKFSVVTTGSGMLAKNVPAQVVMNAPETGQAAGSVAAAVVIYFRRQEVVEQRKAVIEELDCLNEQLKAAGKFIVAKRKQSSAVEIDN